MMKASLIIAAGGSGSRFQKTLQASKCLPENLDKSQAPPSKLFFHLAGKPLLAHTVQVFQTISQIREIVIAAPRDAHALLKAMIRDYSWKNVKIVQGGETRAESVYKALTRTSAANEWVLVHDGARPFVSPEAVEKLCGAAKSCEAAILGKKVVPTIKETESDGSIVRTVDRSRLSEAETPQMMRRAVLLQAYKELSGAFEMTDESSLMERLGIGVKVVTHDGWNPKITTYKDFELAEACLNQHSKICTGFGRDTHRLVEKRKLLLGGIHIPFNKGPLGHSDGDALLHAVTDAILGTMGAGDIGDWFSDKNPKFKNISSTKMLQAVLDEARRKGFSVTHADTVIILEKPKLGTYKKQMKENIARILKLSPENVSVKAKTAEGLGPEGQGLAVTCEAIVTVKSSKR